MLGVLGLDDLGWLTLVRSLFKCLNLNSIMPGVLGPDDLGWKNPSFCLCPYTCPGEFQPLFLCQYLGGSLLKLPEEQEGLSPLLAAQTFGRLVQGERN